MNDHLPRRSHPAHTPLVDVGNRSNIVHVIVCTNERKTILADEGCVEVLLEAWCKADHWVVGRYTVMPDHVHLFCAPNRRDHLPLKNWVEFWKSISAAAWPRRDVGKVWQRDFWDRQLRSGESYSEKWHYVRRNPVRAGFVACPEDWPWQGELNVLMWHDR